MWNEIESNYIQKYLNKSVVISNTNIDEILFQNYYFETLELKLVLKMYFKYYKKILKV